MQAAARSTQRASNRGRQEVQSKRGRKYKEVSQRKRVLVQGSKSKEVSTRTSKEVRGRCGEISTRKYVRRSKYEDEEVGGSKSVSCPRSRKQETERGRTRRTELHTDI